MSPPQIVYAASPGPAPDVEEAHEGARCRICGGACARGRRDHALQPSDELRVAIPASAWTCEACLYVLSRTSPVPGRPGPPVEEWLAKKEAAQAAAAAAGRKVKPIRVPEQTLGANFRNLAHWWDAVGGYGNASKGEKTTIRAVLSRPKVPPWFLALPDRDKHTVPFARLNYGHPVAGRILFGDVPVLVPPDAPQQIARLCDLLTAGPSKEEVEAGRYSRWSWAGVGAKRLRAEEEWLGPLRGGSWFTVLLWVSQRDEEVVAARRAAQTERRGDGRGRGAQGHPA